MHLIVQGLFLVFNFPPLGKLYSCLLLPVLYLLKECVGGRGQDLEGDISVQHTISTNDGPSYTNASDYF